MTYLAVSPPLNRGLRPTGAAARRGLGASIPVYVAPNGAPAYARGLGATALTSVAGVVPGAGAIVSGVTAIGSALGIGGATDQQKAATRVARANELFSCALRGDVGAAQRLLYGAGLFGAPGSGEPASKAQYQQNVSQLASMAPSIYQQAVQAGPQPDTTGKGCISINSTTGTPTVTSTTPVLGSLTGSTPLLLLGGGILVALIMAGGKRARG